MTIQTDFINVAKTNVNLHGQWIPAECWAYLVGGDGSIVKPAKLVSQLDKANMLNQSFMGENPMFGSIQSILCTRHYCKQREASAVKTMNKKKNRRFLCIESKEKSQPTLPEDKTLLTEYFQCQYKTFAHKILPVIEWSRPHAISTTKDESLNQVPTTEAESLDQRQEDQPRTVSPTNSEDSESEHLIDDDIRKLFDGIADESQLKSIFDSSTKVETPKERMKEYGCELHEKDLVKHYEIFAAPA